MANGIHDLIVIGGGIGGLATAALAQRRGLRVALLESHTRLGGCAGWFSREPYTFDAGATALMGLGPGEPIAELLRDIGMEFSAEKTSSYRVHLPDRSLDITPNAAEFERASARTFPDRDDAHRRFWRLQDAVGRRLFQVASRVPRLPARSASDLAYDLKVLGVGGLLAASTWAVTVQDVLRLLGLGDDIPFRALVAMLLQDTAQAGPETVPFAIAAACLHAYRSGMSRPRGGMKALAEGLGQRFATLGGDLRVATLVDRVVPRDGGGFVVETRRRDRLETRAVAFNLPLDRASALLGRTPSGRVASGEKRSRAAWSAVTSYLAIDRDAVPDDAPLFHQVLLDYDAPIHDGNNILISLSPVGDEAYGPANVRVATMSTHTSLQAWDGLDRESHAARKCDFAPRFDAALARALPDAPASVAHVEMATPRSFARYTRRRQGAVGGAPTSRGNTVFFAVPSDILGRGLWVVGDSVFPGQGTMAVVLSAIRVVERITSQPWRPSSRRPEDRELALASQGEPATISRE